MSDAALPEQGPVDVVVRPSAWAIRQRNPDTAREEAGDSKPQATKELQERWHCDVCAFEQLGKNFKEKNGIISPKKGYTPTKDDLSAIDYLVFEWDYGYDG